jgi:large subunit ribosomal protein L41
MFKPTKPLFRKRILQITTKQTPNTTGYYKGNRSGSMGWHTKHSKYIVDRRKVRTYVAPRELFTGVRYTGSQ